MLIRTGLLGAAMAAATVAHAQTFDPADWAAPRLSTEVTVTAGTAVDQFVVRAKVTDINSSRVIATPVLLVAANQPATVEIGRPDAVKLKLIFTVSADGKTASYTNEIQRNGEVQSSHKATLVIATRT